MDLEQLKLILQTVDGATTSAAWIVGSWLAISFLKTIIWDGIIPTIAIGVSRLIRYVINSYSSARRFAIAASESRKRSPLTPDWLLFTHEINELAVHIKNTYGAAG